MKQILIKKRSCKGTKQTIHCKKLVLLSTKIGRMYYQHVYCICEIIRRAIHYAHTDVWTHVYVRAHISFRARLCKSFGNVQAKLRYATSAQMSRIRSYAVRIVIFAHMQENRSCGPVYVYLWQAHSFILCRLNRITATD